MIKAEQKPIDQIRKMIADYPRVLVVGCGTCVTICFAGGEREVADLVSLLRLKERQQGTQKQFLEATVKRVCEREFVDPLIPRQSEVDAILSLSCAVGVQYLAERFPKLPVLPGVNTSFLGLIEERWKWNEVCVACGDCILHLTGGICPIARCAKVLFNGPCGGSVGGKCEISPEVPCAWQKIYDRMASLGQLHKLEEVQPVRNWVSNQAAGPRHTIREDLKITGK